MSAVVHSFLQQAPTLDRQEQLDVVRALVSLLYPPPTTREPGIIRKTPGVVGGSARIRDMRIAVWFIVELKHLGWSNEQIQEHYPSITDEDLAAVERYYTLHKEEIDAEIEENNAE